MKKSGFGAVISTAILCYLFWLLITGQIIQIFRGQFSVQVLVAGVLVSILVGAFSARFFVHESPFYLWNPKRFFTFIIYCIIIFPIELFKANLDVARRAFSPALPVNPGIVKVPVDVKSEYAQSMVANSITLTPGTITMDIVEQEGQTYYYIHWIDVTTQDAKDAGDAIKGTMESWIRRIWE